MIYCVFTGDCENVKLRRMGTTGRRNRVTTFGRMGRMGKLGKLDFEFIELACLIQRLKILCANIASMNVP